ncbi:esterase/lipase family protein [Gordonia rhizosphera]|uniref:AB hydrolase-1 domain-containing protein n=1 Tax=Gordonia rhizosphera NBRC 16068 TaxID=1108045 RepID=K6WCS0_9ACTN|nr:alpha/beta hydrolase [Gordonia rhizosphera]GAB91536.1 hypothetical protein GORHZ_135_00860 [Gordonia rhizosphera NBRC 16068]
MSQPTSPNKPDGARTPTLWEARRELRAPLELATSVVQTRFLRGWPRGDGHPVVVVPGFMAGPESTAFLRRHLRRLNYRVYDWQLGRNRAITPARTAALGRFMADLHERYGQRVSVIGWSAGGVYAREMGHTFPDHTRMVITLASPFNEHLPTTPAWKLYQLVNRGATFEELFTEEAVQRRAEPLPVPTTSVYSRSDGVVAWQSCVSAPAPLNESVEVTGTHMGMIHHIDTLRVVADRLAQREGDWAPYR